jgi:hypothetical protein
MDDVTFSLTVVADEVDGVDSGDEVTVTYEGIAGTRSDESRSFDVVAVHVSSIDINIGSTDNKLVNGEVTL